MSKEIYGAGRHRETHEREHKQITKTERLPEKLDDA